ncbi:C2 domain containing protein [Klebsormidium nitens]|uniref:C2 domain containing protein n=1 Tax=Klebsormidium nitens TaxID=105231 RepID=A0A1Y1HKN6_KLENI|nr:C2 domain containing protein [Klebsormidium nitens]|eukprot:GAQ79165.1 C2 domain containing protein [Klebsormidium nitens]
MGRRIFRVPRQAGLLLLGVAGGTVRFALGVVVRTTGFSVGAGLGILVGSYVFNGVRWPTVEVPEIVPVSDMEDDDMLEHLQLDIPSWVRNPDIQSVHWLNKCMIKMWPHVNVATQKWFIDDFWPNELKKNLPPGLQPVWTSVTFGDLPPIIEGIKVFEMVADEVIMEPIIKWASSANLLGTLRFGARRIQCQISEINLFVKGRVTFRPLVDHFPCFSALQLSIVETPHLDFAAKLGGSDLLALPLVQPTVERMLQGMLRGMFLWPRHLNIGIGDDHPDSRRPAGTLQVRLVKAEGLINRERLFTDPFVKLYIKGDDAQKSRMRSRTTAPLWDEFFSFRVDDEKTDVLTVEVTNFQLIGKNLLLGITNIPVMSLNPNQLTEIEAALDLPPRAASLSKSSLTKINLNHNVNLLAKSAYEATKSATDLLPTLFEDPDKPKKKVSDKDNGHGVITLEVTYLPFRDPNALHCDPMVGREEPPASAAAADGNGDTSPLQKSSSRLYSSLSGRRTEDIPLEEKGPGLLIVTVHQGLDLEARHNGTSNPYCKINVLGEWMHSKTVAHDLSPRWAEEFEFLLDDAPIDGVLLLEVWTRFTYWGKESLGIARIPLGDVVRNRRILDVYPLDGVKTGAVKLEMEWHGTRRIINPMSEKEKEGEKNESKAGYMDWVGINTHLMKLHIFEKNAGDKAPSRHKSMWRSATLGSGLKSSMQKLSLM